jgi:hypothetical protein
LPDLAPERRLIAAKPFENSVIEVGQTGSAANAISAMLKGAGFDVVRSSGSSQ